MELERFEAAGLRCTAVAPDNAGSSLPLVIGLHGRGDWGESYIDIGPEISETDYRFVFPTAPLRLEGALFEWFRFETNNLGKEAAQARLMLFNLLSELNERYQTPASKTFLFGFSQGGMMTLDAGLRYRDKQGQSLAGLACLSGLLVADNIFRQTTMLDPARYYAGDQGDLNQAVADSAAKKLPIFVAHGIYDPVVPVQAGRATRDFLQGAGLQVEYHEFPGEHQITMTEIEWLGKFINQSILRD